MRLLLEEDFATDDLINPVAAIATRDTSPVGLILRQQEFSAPAAICSGEGQHRPELAITVE